MPQLETKEFYKTSEFYVTVAMNLLAIATQLVNVLPPRYGIPLMGVINMAYTLSRGIAKSGVPGPPS